MKLRLINKYYFISDNYFRSIFLLRINNDILIRCYEKKEINGYIF